MAPAVADFEEAARGHIAACKSQETRALYEGDLRRWLDWCAANSVDVARPTLAQASAYRDALVLAHASLTVRRKLATLSALYDAALSYEVPRASWNPFKRRVRRPEADDYAVTEPISLADKEKIVAVALAGNGLRDVAVIELLHGTGMRVSSALSLLREQLVDRDGVMLIAGVRVKKRGRVEIEVPEEAARVLRAWLAAAPSSRFVFPSRKSHLSRKTFHTHLAAYAEAAGVSPKVGHPHSFRAAFATELFDAGVPLHEVQAAMHHSDPKTTQRYDSGVRGRGVVTALANYRAEKKKSDAR